MTAHYLDTRSDQRSASGAIAGAVALVFASLTAATFVFPGLSMQLTVP